MNLWNAVEAGIKLTSGASCVTLLHDLSTDVTPAVVANEVAAERGVWVPVLNLHLMTIVTASALDAEVEIAGLATRVEATAGSDRELLTAPVTIQKIPCVG